MYKLILTFFFLMGCTSCQAELPVEELEVEYYGPPEYGGASEAEFKVPVPAGYDWEISQSWGEHCGDCNSRYADWDYCSLSHTGSCCEYAWDFNLPGNADVGKDVLASGDGYVLEVGRNSTWGYYVLLDHGRKICSRYSHLLEGSNQHLELGDFTCQGLKLGEVGNTGASEGAHLHFQFEDCENGDSLPMGFDDGNDVPICTRGDDRYDRTGNYNALELSNQRKRYCRSDEPDFGDGVSAWVGASCGALDNCPLVQGCDRGYDHDFIDHASLTRRVRQASGYLWSECALDGKADGGLHPHDSLTRAEALKVPLFLFGLMEQCGGDESEPFLDVNHGEWYYGVVACAVRHRLINTAADYFRPNDPVSFVEAMKFAVESANSAGLIPIDNPASGHFPAINRSHWGYRYAETIYNRGGLQRDPSQIWPDQSIERGDYMVMVASLSPCFCGNVSCDSGCICNQDLMACVDMDVDSPGDSSRALDNLDNVDSSGRSTQRGTGDRGTDESAAGDNVEPAEPRGSADEPSGQEPSDGGSSGPVIEDHPYDGGSSEENSGGCENPPPPEEVDCSLCPCACEQPADPWDGGVAPAVVWECDPELGHVINLDIPGGSFEILMSGDMPYYSRLMLPGASTTLLFDCKDLPASILLHGGESYLHAWVGLQEVASFELWDPWEGEQVLHPTVDPDEISRHFYSDSPYRDVLIRIAPSN